MKLLNPRRLHVNWSPTFSMSDSSRLNTGTIPHRSTCTMQGTEESTAVQCNTVDLQFARCNLYYNVLQNCKVLCTMHCSRYLLRNAVQQSYLQFALCKQYYKELQCNTRDLHLALSQMLQCNICDKQFPVLFTLYGTAVIQICNRIAFEQKRCTSLSLF